MKKFLALLLAMVTVLAMCSSVSAAQITLRQYPMPAQVVKTVQLTDTCGLKQRQTVCPLCSALSLERCRRILRLE